MNRKCPRCGSLCPIYAREVGKTQDCWDCGARLVLQEDGLHLIEGEEDEPARPAPRSKGRAPAAPSAAADPFTWLFALGAIVVLLCQTLPMIQKANLESINARLMAGDLDIKKAKRDLDDRKDERREQEGLRKRERDIQTQRDALAEKKRKAGINPDRPPPFAIPGQLDNPLAKEEEAIDKLASQLKADSDKFDAKLKTEFSEDEEALAKMQTDWTKERARIDLDERGDAEVSALSRARWYSWATLVGLLLLTVGSLGFLGPQQPTAKRILGVIVLGALVLFLIGKASGSRSLFAAIMPNPLGNGLAAYDLSTPRAALVAESEMALNRDIQAEIDLNVDEDNVKERIHTLVVHRDVDAGNNQRVLFVTYRDNGVTKYRTPIYELVPSRGIWRNRGASEYSLKRNDQTLVKQMRDWQRQGDPSGRLPDDL